MPPRLALPVSRLWLWLWLKDRETDQWSGSAPRWPVGLVTVILPTVVLAWVAHWLTVGTTLAPVVGVLGGLVCVAAVGFVFAANAAALGEIGRDRWRRSRR